MEWAVTRGAWVVTVLTQRTPVVWPRALAWLATVRGSTQMSACGGSLAPDVASDLQTKESTAKEEDATGLGRARQFDPCSILGLKDDRADVGAKQVRAIVTSDFYYMLLGTGASRSRFRVVEGEVVRLASNRVLWQPLHE